MTGFNQIERSRRTAIYIRISTSQQQTDRQETELKEFALRNGLNFNEKTTPLPQEIDEKSGRNGRNEI